MEAVQRYIIDQYVGEDINGGEEEANKDTQVAWDVRLVDKDNSY